MKLKAPAAVRDLATRARSRKLAIFGNVLGGYHCGVPSTQATVDLFAGEWASRLPAAMDGVGAGVVPLFEDDRIAWAIGALGGVEDESVLELGPLEGGHTFMLQQAGARSVVAVESNGRAYLKCVVVKELLGLDRAHFLLGDATAYLGSTEEPFDVCLASGILYHMADPVALIAAISARVDKLIMWTHYFDPEVARINTQMRRHMKGSRQATHDGFSHELHEHRYGTSLRFAGFAGGTQPFANWLSRDDLMACLEHYGWGEVQIAFEQRDHPHGPCLALVARKA